MFLFLRVSLGLLICVKRGELVVKSLCRVFVELREKVESFLYIARGWRGGMYRQANLLETRLMMNMKKREGGNRGLFLGWLLLMVTGCVKVKGDLTPYIEEIREKASLFVEELRSGDVVLEMRSEEVPLLLGEDGESFSFSLPEGVELTRVESVAVKDKVSGVETKGYFSLKQEGKMWSLEFEGKVPVGRYSVVWEEEDYVGETSSVNVVSEGLTGDDVVVRVLALRDAKTLEIVVENAVLSFDGEGRVFVVNDEGKIMGGVARKSGDKVILVLDEAMEAGFYQVVFARESLMSLGGETIKETFLSGNVFLGKEFVEGEHLISVAGDIIDNDSISLLGIGDRGGEGWVSEGVF